MCRIWEAFWNIGLTIIDTIHNTTCSFGKFFLGTKFYLNFFVCKHCIAVEYNSTEYVHDGGN